MTMVSDGKVTDHQFNKSAPHGWIILLRDDRVLCDVCVSAGELGVQIRQTGHVPKHTEHFLLAQPDCLEKVIDLLKRHGI